MLVQDSFLILLIVSILSGLMSLFLSQIKKNRERLPE